VGGCDVSGRYRKRAAVIGDRYRKRPLQTTVTGSGRYRRPLQEAGGRYISNALRKGVSTVYINEAAIWIQVQGSLALV
jgi:hypothetical protein